MTDVDVSVVPEDLGTLLIIDDDQVLADRLAKAMARRGFTPHVSYTVEDGIVTARSLRPDYAVVDLRLTDGSGLRVIEEIHEHAPHCRAVMLTAFGNIATAVAAVKSGAIDYLSKPADADAVTRALLEEGDHGLPPPPEDPMTAERVRWEHIQRIYEQCDRNVSETARRLRMHRRTLQRILAKYAPREG